MGLLCGATSGREWAVKALHLYKSQDAWGHVVAELLSELPKELSVPATLVEKAKVLDNFYMPTRCANAHPSGAAI